MKNENTTPSLSHSPVQIARTNPSTGSAYSNPIRLEECNENDGNDNNNDDDDDDDESYHNDVDIPVVDSLNGLLGNANANPQPNGAESEAQVEADIHNKKESLSNSSSVVVTKSVSDDITEKSASEQHQEDLYYNDHQYPYDESRPRPYVRSFEDAHPHEEQQQQEEQEWTHEDHDRSPHMTSYHRSKEERRKQRQIAYDRAERRRLNKCMYFAVLVLLLEVAAGTIAVMYYQELIECCGRSIFGSTSTNGDSSGIGEGGNEINDEIIAARWNTIFYWVGISYLIVIILIEIPTLVIATEPLFIFNPMVGFLLAMHMMYTTDAKTAYIIYGLETAAMVGQSIVLVHMRRSPELCIHSILNYTFCGLVIYVLVRLTEQGGYCIVNDRIQSIFSASTCNIECIDDVSCFRCDVDTSSCFIQFSTS